MHFKNGRLAKNGDRVVNVVNGLAGILHSTNAGATSCNGRIAETSQNDAYVNVSDCVHIDDVQKATNIPDSSAPAPVAPVAS